MFRGINNGTISIKVRNKIRIYLRLSQLFTIFLNTQNNAVNQEKEIRRMQNYHHFQLLELYTCEPQEYKWQNI